MKKTFQWLEKEGISYEFIDYKKEEPNIDLLKGFLDQARLAELINRKGTTFKKLSTEQKSLLENQDTALPILAENSSMIKRPLIQFPDGQLVVGFQEEEILDKAKPK